MIMKKYYLPLSLALLVSVTGCRKEENIDFKFDTELDYVPTELDHWLTKNFTDPYNMEVVYRFDRYKMGELNVNLSPPKEEKVIEQMEMIRNGFILPFEKAAGITFSKNNFPKEWVLSGSYHLDPNNGERILATSAGGRNITIHEVNSADTTNAEVTRRKLKTVHHEFAHTLTQVIRIPREFEMISEANYSASWANSSIWPEAKNLEQGFVTRYARASVMEDFAETVGHLIVYGQLWYDARAGSMPKSGYDILKQKEAIVVKFYRDNYNIDFRMLQREMAHSMFTRFNDVFMQSFKYWFFDQGAFNRTLGISTATYGTGFADSYQDFKTRVGTISSVFGKWAINDMNFVFAPTTPTSGGLTVKVTAKEGSRPVVNLDFTFTYVIDVNHRVRFTKINQPTGSQDWNLHYLMPHFLPSISKYLTDNSFAMDWSLANPTLTRRDEGFFKNGGFYKGNDRTDYINFQLKALEK